MLASSEQVVVTSGYGADLIGQEDMLMAALHYL